MPEPRRFTTLTHATAAVVIAGVAGIVFVDIYGKSGTLQILIAFVTLALSHLFQMIRSEQTQREVPQKVEQVVEQANEKQRRDIRHDVRNEVTPIKGGLEVIEKRTNGELDQRIVKAIYEAAEAAVNKLWDNIQARDAQNKGGK